MSEADTFEVQNPAYIKVQRVFSVQDYSRFIIRLSINHLFPRVN